MNVNPKTPGSDKLGDASNQWAEVNALSVKQNGEAVAPINSPAFTGTPTAPTPGSSDDSTKIATTAWVRNYAPLGDLAALDTVGAAQIDAGAVGATQLASTGVTAGSYSLANITVDADGRITAAANGTATAAAVPAEVSMAQFRLALLAAGIDPNTIAQSLAGDPAALIRWEYSATVRRAHPLVNAMAAQLGKTAADVDDIFRHAATL